MSKQNGHSPQNGSPQKPAELTARVGEQELEAAIENDFADGHTVGWIAAKYGINQKFITDGPLRTARTRGIDRRNSDLQSKQFQVAMGGNASMLMWLGKQWLGQREKVAVATKITLVEGEGEELAPATVLTIHEAARTALAVREGA